MRKAREAAVRTQVVDAVAPFPPFWRARLKALGRPAASVPIRPGPAGLPAVGERDGCPDGDLTGAGVARDVRVACGLRSTQVVIAEAGDLPHGAGPTRRLFA